MPRVKSRSFLYLLFLLSGVAGLFYQVAWIRQYGNVFGVTIYSASIVTAVFMGGLGLGGWLGGRWADSAYARSPARVLAAYGYVEIAIGGLGLCLAYALPKLAGLSAGLSSYEPLELSRWHGLAVGSSLLRYACAALLLTPSTLLMGLTLPLIVRFVVGRDVEQAGWRVGALYGLNTAGAALGCFLSDFALIPTQGLARAQHTAALLNVTIGIGALLLARGTVPAGRSEKPPVSEADEQPPPRRLLGLTAAALGCSGITAMGLEIVWFRFLTGSLGQYRSVISLVLTVLLVGLWLGAVLGGYLHRRYGRPAHWLMLVQGSIVAVSMIFITTFDPVWVKLNLLAAFAGLSQPAGGLSAARQYWAMIRPTAFVVLLPAVLMGASYPLANAHVQRTVGRVGRLAGSLYLATTAGNVVGVLGCGFVLLPALGAQGTMLCLGAVAVLAVLLIYPTIGRGADTSRGAAAAGGRRVVAASLGLSVGAVMIWALALPPDYLLRRQLAPLERGSRYLTAREGINEVLAVSEDRHGSRTLWTNGHTMSGTEPAAQRYMRAFSHIPLLQLANPTSALVICFGVGTTAHAASLHPLQRLEVVDLSRAVLDHAPYYRRTNRDVLTDARVQIYVNDGRHHLRMQPPGSYHLITLEPPPIAAAGVAALYSVELYELARSRLMPGGYLTQWLPAYQVDGQALRQMIAAFLQVFPAAVLLSGHRTELILMGVNAPTIEIDLPLLAHNLRARPQVLADLRQMGLGTLTELVGTFVAEAETLRAVVGDAPPLGDDRPAIEYSQLSHASYQRIPAELFDVSRVGHFCPSCFEGPRPVPAVKDLPDYLAVLGALYQSDELLLSTSLDLPVGAPPVFTPAMRRTIAADPYLRSMLGPRLGLHPSPRRTDSGAAGER